MITSMEEGIWSCKAQHTFIAHKKAIPNFNGN